MLQAWERQVQTRPGAPSIHYFDVTLTIAEIDRAASLLAVGLLDSGLQPGDRMAIYLQNDPQWLVALLAGWKCGAVPVAVNPMLRAEELRHVLGDSGARALVCLDSLFSSVREVAGGTELCTIITTHPLDMTPDAAVPDALAARMSPRQIFDAASDWRITTAGRSKDAVRQGECPATADIAALVYTSGTTGPQKGAMNTHSAMVHSSAVYCRWWDIRPEHDVIVGLAPLFHITGLIAVLGAHILGGAPIVLMHRFDAEYTLRAVQRWQGTFMIGASTAFIALINHPALAQIDVSSLTKTVSGGAPVSPALIDRVRAATGWTLRGAYGLTETTSPTHLGPVAVDPPTDPESGATAVGIPVPGARVRIVDPATGADLPLGGTGEIVVSGPMVVPGYWRRPEESARAIVDGWLHTGDIGKMIDGGWLFVIDRLKDVINVAGYKVFPRDVEDVLYRHPAVLEAAVVGVPDDYRGETVKAFVSLTQGATTSPQEIIGFCRDRMAAYKYPRSVVIVDELPKNTAGKILRRELRRSVGRPSVE